MQVSNHSEKEKQKVFLPEIQGLRCWAVLMVVIFHIWPAAIPGGFIGVDVFFVISGFLITGLLIKEAENKQYISLVHFYARRILRLLPMATLVIVVSSCANILFLPADRWVETIPHILASTLYVENWWLSALAVDYLGAENMPSPLQHYWSLSIEEQFYFIWPLLIIMGIWLSSIQGMTIRRMAFWILLVLTITSLAASALLTRTTLDSAYFLTHTRILALGAGGLLSLLKKYPSSPLLRHALTFAGIAVIIGSSTLIKPEMHFPGWIVIFPVIGTMAVIAGGGAGLIGFLLLRTKPVRFIGDISYSVYLWHWPLIIYYTASHGNPDMKSGFLLLLATLIISSFSKRYIEDYFYKNNDWKNNIKRTYTLGAVLTLAALASALLLHLYALHSGKADIKLEKDYPGAEALTHNVAVHTSRTPIPPLTQLRKDLPDVYTKKCHLGYKDTVPVACEYGPTNAELHIVITGDSHAAQWIPALSKLASQHNWRLTTYTKSGCVTVDAPIAKRGDEYTECRKWANEVINKIAAIKPDIVIQTNARSHRLMEASSDTPDESTFDMMGAYHKTWELWHNAGIQIAVIADTPRLSPKTTDCVSNKRKDCVYSRAESIAGFDPLAEAARTNNHVLLIDMIDGICMTENCPAIIGNVIVFRDTHHLTMTYSKTLSRRLEDRLASLINRAK